MSAVRTRFAPSPTGFLHIGSARTALFSWLHARHHKGTFILRIEDTDRERSTQSSIDAILEGMKWLGLDWDEGPFFQMERLSHYQKIAESWIQQGLAYRCNCSKDRLEHMRIQQLEQKLKPRYDGHCRQQSLAPAHDCVIRFKTPEDGSVSFEDDLHGTITVKNNELDDVILLRSDGVPTYNFAVVVDDSEMNITHVIRGDDHINNTPRQIHLYQALQSPLPRFTHLPMILGPDGKRLSKRHGAVSVLEYRNQGVLPTALLNYLLRLGWSHGDQEIFSQAEMIDFFGPDGLNKSPASFNEEKLQWVNQHYLKNTPSSQLVPVFQEQCRALSIDIANTDLSSLESILKVQADRYKTLHEIAEKSRYFFTEQVEWEPEAQELWLTSAQRPIFEATSAELASLSAEEWSQERISAVLKGIVSQQQLKFPQVAQPLRVALTGSAHAPSIDWIIFLLGKKRVLGRIERVLKQLA